MFPFGTTGGRPASVYQIDRSLRFNDDDSAYLSRTQGTGTSRRIFTWSGWVKRGNLTFGAFSTLFNAGSSTTDTLTFNNSGDALRFFLDGASGADLITTAQFRDPSAWYHVVLAVDTTQGTAANRVKIYVNGAQVTAFSTATYPALNYDCTELNVNGVTANIGSISTSSYFDGYLSEIHYIDGQALDPTSFGEFDTNGVWRPIRVSGLTYGTNGFYLSFADNTSTTTLGYDDAGSNDWTLNNFSVAAGVGNDSLEDTPTNNYCTFNPLPPPDSFGQATSLLNGNLQVKGYNVAFNTWSVGTIAVSSGKWYWELTNSNAADFQSFGVVSSLGNLAPVDATVFYDYYSSNGNKRSFGVNTAYGSTWTTNDIIGVALDLDNGKIWFAKNNTWQASGDPVAGTNAAFTGLSGSFLPSTQLGSAVANSAYANFGQRPFAYTPPTGFSALNTANLDNPGDSTPLTGSFTGNASADGPFVWLGYPPDKDGTNTINSNAITWGTHADALANGIKLRTSSSSYNTAGSNTYSIAIDTSVSFADEANAQVNP